MLPALTRIIVTTCLLAISAETTPTIVVPHFHDLTIKNRIKGGRSGEFTVETDIWYFKGSRVRQERLIESDQPDQAPENIWVNITQCDHNAYYFLDGEKKTYQFWSVPKRITEFRDALKGEPGGGEIVITFDSVDTGQRRQVGSYVARRIKTTTSIDPSANSGARRGKMESDGWYVDLPGWDLCLQSSQQGWWGIETEPDHHPRILERWRGVKRGFPIELTTKITEVGCPDSFGCHPGAQSPPIEFAEISEQPLDQALFEVPKDYTRIDH